jgi:hypothetical protein
MPTLTGMRNRVYRDLADDNQVVFTNIQVEDFIRAGIAELNRVAPTERYEDITPLDQITEYAVDIVRPIRLVIRSYEGSEVGSFPLVEADDTIYATPWGYRFWQAGEGGMIELPLSVVQSFVSIEQNAPTFRLYGYGNRDIPYITQELSDPEDPQSPLIENDPETGLNADDEYSVRQYAKSEGFDLLTHDRSLFAQWQGQTNNTDVSPVMMMNMAASAKAAWNDRRGLIRVLRKDW